MDWSKAKNIFMITFLLLNLLLGYQLYLKQSEYSHNMRWTTNNMNELKAILKQQNIQLNVEVPKEVPKMHFIQIKNNTFSMDENVKLKVEQPIDQNLIDSLGRDLIQHFEEYQLNSFASDQQYFVYEQIRNGFPFFEAKLEIHLDEEQNFNYTQNYFQVINKGLDRQVISSYSALRTVLDQELIPQGAEIQQIVLGYYGQINQTSIQVLTPVWKILYVMDKKSDALFVNAMTGGLENRINY